jgi:hypothetical protein
MLFETGRLYEKNRFNLFGYFWFLKIRHAAGLSSTK